MLRPVKWCRQTEDKIINDIEVGKDRELYEPVINPTSTIIQSVGIGSTVVYVQSVRPFFNPKNEISTANLTFQDKIKITRPAGSKVAAAATAVVSAAGTISSFTISEGGVGYGATPTVSIVIVRQVLLLFLLDHQLHRKKRIKSILTKEMKEL